ncbi:MAG TPA: response regulator [Verrucomicrobiota bacterium]|nr:response regulator [Verrucomicrobiota bacterium]HNU50230.1 response regulator [Verrucomicrobiota bacterium]
MTSNAAEEGGSTGALGQGQRVLLIVDDDEALRQSLRLVFEERYEVLLAASGEEAVEVCRNRHVDGALVDFHMTGMTGTEVLDRLKAMDPGMEVILLSGNATLDSARDAVRLGACEYLTKPYEVPDLIRSVERMMDRRRLTDHRRANLDRLKALEEETRVLRSRVDLVAPADARIGQVLDQINRPLTLIAGILAILNRRLSGADRLEGEAMGDFRERLQTLNREADVVIDAVAGVLRTVHRAQAGEGAGSVSQAVTALEGLSATLAGSGGVAQSPQTLESMERQAIVVALRRHKGNKLAASRELGITRQTLYNKIKAYQIEI